MFVKTDPIVSLVSWKMANSPHTESKVDGSKSSLNLFKMCKGTPKQSGAGFQAVRTPEGRGKAASWAK